jgi:hypothetical protein
MFDRRRLQLSIQIKIGARHAGLDGTPRVIFGPRAQARASDSRYATGVQVEMQTAREYRTFLEKRVRAFAKTQPGLRELRRVLLKIGGDELVPPADGDPMTSFLLDFGIVFGGPVVVRPGGQGGSVRMLGRIWNRRLHGIKGIGVGYALDGDRLWREHSFGVLREGVLETTAPKQKYFGLLLIDQAADGFAETACRPRTQ